MYHTSGFQLVTVWGYLCKLQYVYILTYCPKPTTSIIFLQSNHFPEHFVMNYLKLTNFTAVQRHKSVHWILHINKYTNCLTYISLKLFTLEHLKCSYIFRKCFNITSGSTYCSVLKSCVKLMYISSLWVLWRHICK